MQVVVIIGVETLSQGRKQSGKCGETPDPLAEWTSETRSLPAEDRRHQWRQRVNPIAPERRRVAPISQRDNHHVHENKSRRRCNCGRAQSRHLSTPLQLLADPRASTRWALYLPRVYTHSWPTKSSTWNGPYKLSDWSAQD